MNKTLENMIEKLEKELEKHGETKITVSFELSAVGLHYLNELEINTVTVQDGTIQFSTTNGMTFDFEENKVESIDYDAIDNTYLFNLVNGMEIYIGL